MGRRDARYPTSACEGFFPCVAGMGAPVSCPTGTLFDVALDVCNWERHVAACPQADSDDETASRRRRLLAVGWNASSGWRLEVGGLALVVLPALAVGARLASSAKRRAGAASWQLSVGKLHV